MFVCRVSGLNDACKDLSISQSVLRVQKGFSPVASNL